jgi:hypothetical protein
VEEERVSGEERWISIFLDTIDDEKRSNAAVMTIAHELVRVKFFL